MFSVKTVYWIDPEVCEKALLFIFMTCFSIPAYPHPKQILALIFTYQQDKKAERFDKSLANNGKIALKELVVWQFFFPPK